MTDGGKDAGRGRFRRPDWVPPGKEETPPPEGANLPAVDPARTARELASALAPLKDLAQAFRENSEALKSIADGQDRMAKRLDRSDRSEAVIRSTQALNDTFRGVQRTQERLMGRLEGEKRKPWYLLAGVLVLVAALVGGTIWFLTGWADRRETESRTSSDERWQTALGERDAQNRDLQDRLAAVREDLSRERSAREAAEAAAAPLRQRIDELVAANAELKDSQAGVTRLARENATLTTEVAEREKDLSAANERVGELQAEIAEKDSEIARLDRRIRELEKAVAGVAGGAAPAEGAGPSGPEPTAGEGGEGGPEEPAKPAIPREAAQNPAEIARVMGVLNGLLLDSKSSESYRFVKIGGIRGRILYDVVLRILDDKGQEAKRIEAAEARILVDEAQRRAEIRFRNGHLVYYGVRAPFWGDTYVVPLADIDPAAWLRSGLTIFDR